MSFSLNLNYTERLPVTEAASLIRAAGFTHTFLWWAKSIQERYSSVKAAVGAGLTVEAAHFEFIGINSMWLDGEEGDSFLHYMIRSVREAKAFSIPTVVVHLSSGDNPPEPNEKGLERYRRIVEEGEKQGINIAFENLRKIRYLDYVIERIDSPALRFCYDCGHENVYNGGKGVLEEYCDILSCMHLHDNDGKTDLHMLPFDERGTVNWSSVGRRIGDYIPRSVPVALEVFAEDAAGNEICDPRTMPAKAFEAAQRIAAYIG